MFSHVFKNTFKVLLRQKELLFWSLIFPMILAGLFKMTLGNIDNTEQFEKIEVAVIKNDQDFAFNEFIDSTQDELLSITYTNDEQASQLLEDNEVVGIIKYPTLKVKQSGVSQSIVETLLNRYKQVESTLMTVGNPSEFEAIIDELSSSNNHIVLDQSKEMSFANIYFYTLVGMQSIYGYLFGLEIITHFEGNLSVKAKRQLVAPIKKTASILSSLLVGWIIHVIIMFVNILFMNSVLNISFGPHLLPILLLVAIGSWCGVALGVFIGASNTKDYEYKIGLGIAIAMAMSFLAGMMVGPIRLFVQNRLPFLAYINPIHMITNALYSLYYYTNLNQFWYYTGFLTLIAIVFTVLSIMVVRGKQYDSL